MLAYIPVFLLALLWGWEVPNIFPGIDLVSSLLVSGLGGYIIGFIGSAIVKKVFFN